MKHLHIIGGGLAGLSLSRGLARAEVPVTVYEKNHYPRHKVCGEFITGLDHHTRELLDLDPILADARLHRHTAWYWQNRLLFQRELPKPALGLSRWSLDARLAGCATRAGVDIQTPSRLTTLPTASAEGWVCAAGVKRHAAKGAGRSRWLGLKAHYTGLRPAEDLELHLGNRAYAGLSAVEGGHFNVCMLMDTRGKQAVDLQSLESALAAVGLTNLADRLRAGHCVPGSRVATAGLVLNAGREAGGAIVVGDAASMIPPFTGHGMAMAFQSAALSVYPLIAYARGEATWNACRARIHRAQRKSHRRRLYSARLLHPWLLLPGLQRIAAGLSASPFLPWRVFYGLTH